MDINNDPLNPPMPNQAPVLMQPLHDGMTWEDGPMAYSAPFMVFSDPEGGPLTYSASLAGGAPLPAWLHMDPLSMQFYGTPQNQDVGTYLIQVTAMDDQGATASDDFQLVVMNTNDAPVLVNPVPDQVVTAGQYFWQPIPFPIFQDEDMGDWLTYSVFSPTGDTSWLLFDPYSGSISGTPSPWNVGTHAIDVHVMDSSGAMAMDTFYLTVEPGNTPPIGGGWVPMPAGREDEPYTIRASDLTAGFIDPEGAPLSVQWLTAWGPAGVLTDNGDQTWTYQPPADFNGTVQLTYQVSDGFHIVPASTMFEVTPVNDAPVAVGTVPDQFAAAGVPVSMFTYLGLFSDVDGWNLSLSASLQDGSPLPAWLTFDPWTATFSGTPPVEAEGTTLLLRITATDPHLASATQDFQLQITEAPPPPPISGTAGNDVLYGTALDDVIYGYDGMDQLYGLDGDDLLEGGNGTDRLYGGAGNDTLVSGDGGGTLDGGDGDDTLHGGTAYELLFGRAGNDTIYGGVNGGTLIGEEGNDLLVGGAGDDQLSGGTGDDVLQGAGGADYLHDDGGDNVLDGGDGNDLIYAHDFSALGTYVVDGGSGDDVLQIFLSRAGSAATVTGGTGRDLFFAQSSDAAPLVITDFEGGAGGDMLNFESLLLSSTGYTGGNPFDPAVGYLRLVDDGTKTELQWNSTADSVSGAWKTVVVMQGTRASDLTIHNFVPGAAPDGSLQGLTITGTELDEQISGSVGADHISALDGGDTVRGYSGDDVIDGGMGQDNLYGDQGNDVLRAGDGGGQMFGGDGDDLLEGGSGYDTMWGDAGNDTLVSGGWSFSGGGIESMYGGDGDDSLTGDMGNENLDGGAGDDVLRAGWGADTLQDSGGSNFLYGEEGDDYFFVADYHGAGSSILDGGAGSDQFMVSFVHAESIATVTGGAGQDRFNLDAYGAPVVTDFEAGPGGDVLAIDTLLLRSSGYAGGNPFDPSLGFFRVLVTEEGTEIQWDRTGTAGDGTWQTVAKLQGTLATQLTIDNFVPAGVVTSLHIEIENGAPVGAPAAVLAPVAEDQTSVLSEATLLDGFSDPEGATLSVQVLTADHGTLVRQADGNWLYTPEANFHGAVTFSYQVSDGTLSVTATQTLQVQSVNDAPQGTPIAGLTAQEDALVSISSAQLLLGFGDVDGDTLSVTQLQVSQGTLVDAGDGTWNYQPPANYSGEVRFAYAVSDGVTTTPAELVMQVTPTPDAPVVVAAPADQVLLAGSTVQFTVAASFQDADPGDTLQFSASAADGSALPAWLSFDAATATFSGTVPANAAGTSLEVMVVATDSTQLSITDVFTLYLEPAGASEGDDVLNGTAGNDTIDGLGGNDVINGLGGDDRLMGGTGHDQIDGGAGSDVIEGGEGWDLVSGGSGFDTFIVRRLDSGVDRIGDYAAGERIVFDNNGVATTAAEYTLTVDGPDTVLRYGEHPQGADVEVRLGGVHTGTLVVQQQWIDGRMQEVVFIAQGNLGMGTAGSDILYGSVDGDILVGLGGSDQLFGYGGDDLLDGGDGYDQLYGGQGNDTLISGSGGGRLEGGQGDDLLQGGDGWEEMFGGEGNDTLVSMEGGGHLSGEGGDDLLQGGSGYEYMYGGSGNDILIANGGGGQLHGQDGDDTLIGGDGDDAFYDNSGTNVMEGGAGADQFHVYEDWWGPATNNTVIDGGAGNDSFTVRLNNAASTATITGGEGSDVFMLDPGSAIAPVITDFAAGAGGDLLHIEQLLNASAGYTGGNPFDPALGYLRLVADGGDAQLQWNSGGAAGGGSWKAVAILQGMAGADLTLHNFSPAAPPDGSAAGLQLVGTPDTDVLYGSVVSDTISGLGGSDQLFGYGGDDLLDGGDGYDQLYGGQGNDTLISGSGGGRLEGGQGDDLLQGGDGWEEMFGGEGNDTLVSMEGGGHLSGEGGDDLLQGGSGYEYMYGGSGNDILIANGGGGQLHGQDGDDTLIGGDGDDAFYDNSGTNVMEGGAGADQFHVYEDWWGPATNNTVIDGGAGNDSFTVRLNNAASTATITGGEGSDVFMLDPGSAIAPVITDFAAGAGGDLLHIEQLLNASAGYTGGNPFDPALGYLRLVADGGDAQLQWNSGGAAGGGSWKAVAILQGMAGADLTLHNFSPAAPPDGSAAGLQLVGTPDTDVLYGSVVSDTISGLGGSDQLFGYGGDDLLDGGDGYDQLYGGQGNDTLISGSGGGRLEGGQGDDLLQGGDGWEEMFGGEGNDTLVSMEGGGHLSGEGGDDLLQGGSGYEYMYGGSGNDILIANGGGGQLHGQDGDDTLIGGDGDDAFYDNSGTNVMEGGAGADQFHVYEDWWGPATNNTVIDGGAGNDSFTVRLNNAASTATITGGEGSDVFMLDPGSAIAPVITDFAAGVGGDLLHIEQLLNASSGYTGGNPFDPALGYLRLAANGPHTLLQWDSTGSGNGSSWKTVAELRGTYAFDLAPPNFAPSTAVTNIEVVVVNSPPSLADALDDLVANEGGAFSFTIPEGTFVDPDAGDALAYSASLADGSALPAWLTFDAATRSFSGTPDADAAGELQIRITATDAGGLSANAQLTLTVQEVDEGPVGSPTASLPPAAEDDSYLLSAASLLEGFTDGDGQPLSVQGLTADHGTLAQQADGDWLYTPDPDFNGVVTFTYEVTDGTNAVAATQTLEVLAINDDPAGDPTGTFAQTALEDVPYQVTSDALLAGFTDADGDTLQVAGLFSDQGTLVDNFDGTWTFQADPEASGPVTFQFDVVDGQGGAFSATRTLDVLPVNDAPELAAPLPDQSGQERTAFEFALPPDTFTDVDAGDTLAYSATLADGAALPAWLTFDAASATFTGTPPEGTAGDLVVEVVATDSGGAEARATFVLTIDPRGNEGPVGDASGLLATGDEDTPIVIDAADLLEGFEDPDGDPLSILNLVASNGTLTDLGNGTWQFAPDEHYAGPVALEYDVADPFGGTVSTTQSFLLRAVADAPIIDAAPASGEEDSAIGIPVSAALEDLDGSEVLTLWLHALPDGTTLTDGANSFTASGDAATVDITGWDWASLAVTAPADFSGSFTLRLEAVATEADGTEASLAQASTFADLVVQVSAVADAPVLVAADVQGDEDTPIALDIAAALSDTDGSESLGVEIRGIPDGAVLRTAGGDLVAVDGGVATFSAAQVAGGILDGLTFTAAPHANGTVVLEVTATSSEANGATATTTAVFSIEVLPVNDAPTLSRPLEDQQGGTGTEFSYTIPADTFADVDAGEGDTLTLTASLADGGELPAWLVFDAASGTFSGTPGAQDGGELHIRVTATDSAGASVSDDFLLSLNTPPTASDDSAMVVRATATALDVLGNDADVDGDALFVSEVGAAANGTTSIDALGRILYTGNAGFIGYDAFEYTVSDGRGGTASAVVNVEVASHLGTAGNDTLAGSNAADWMLGLAGADTLDGLLGNDYIHAGAGNDTLTGGGGADVLHGGDGNDTFLVRGNDWTGDDIQGGEGTDTVRFTGAVTLGAAGMVLAGVEVLDMAGQRLTVQGSQLLDLSDLTIQNAAGITGDTAANAIIGSASSDNISGAAGDDFLDGAGGDDVLTGGAGADQLAGGDGNDVFLAAGTELSGDSIDGGAGVDTLRLTGATSVSPATLSLVGVELLDLRGYTLTVQGNAVLDLGGLQLASTGTIAGDAAANQIIGTQGDDTITGGAGNDVLSGGMGNDTLSGGAGADILSGGDGADTFRVGSTELGDDTISGGAGLDTLLFTSAVSLTGAFSMEGVEVLDMAGQALNVAITQAVDLSSLQLVRGGAINGDAKANTIIGTAGDDAINGGGGNDVLDGSAGNDVLTGGAGADRLSGGDGNDVFRVGATDLTGDVLDGGAGVDTLQLTANTSIGPAGIAFGGIEVLDMGGRTLTVQGAAALDLSALEVVNAGQIDGDAAGNNIAGTRGADSIDGGSGNDNLAGGAGADTLRGGTGADVLRGGAGNDTLYGSRNDRADGFADTFVFDEALDPASNVDAVIGFDANGLDRIALDPTLFAAVTGGASAGVDAGEFRASVGGNAADADDFILYDSATGNLFYDADGSGAGAKVLFATLSGVTGTVDAADFTTQLPPQV